MRLSIVFINAVAVILGAVLCVITAGFAVSTMEDRTEIAVRRGLDNALLGWAEVQADGLKVVLSGTAPDEASRFAAMSTTGGIVDAARIIDALQIAPYETFAPPRFSAEILRNESGISIIGLIPAETDRAALVERLDRISANSGVTDLLETARYPVPDGWEDAMRFAVATLADLPRSKISVQAGQVAVTAIADSGDAKRSIEAELGRTAPPGLRLALSISAPRPVITPFTLRFTLGQDGARFDACSAESEAARDRILAAAHAVGLTDKASCTIGLGVPSPDWARAAELSLDALGALGAGTVTLADADITLVAAQGTDEALFDKIVGEFEAALPQVFALRAVLPTAEGTTETGIPEFVATLSPEGLVQLRGRLNDENLRHMADSYARARFGSESVYTAARVADGLPVDWPVRVLAGLEVLSLLANGVLTVTPDNIELRGISEREEAGADIAGLLAGKLGGSGTFDLDITFRAPPKRADTAPDPEVCEADIAAVQSSAKIAFEPGSATIAASAGDTIAAIADILAECGQIRLEIQGHTDSQGRESMNQNLSQSRAQSVLNELRARRILTSTYVAVGYGETRPIADNDTAEGREDNRRIEFRLIRPGAMEDTETTLEGAARDVTGERAATDDAAQPADDPGAPAADETQGDAPENSAPAQGTPEEKTNEQN